MTIENLYKEMEQYAQEYHVPIINEQGRKFFVQLIKEINPKFVLEIGTAIGYSALLTCHYSSQEVNITSLELDADRIVAAKRFIAKSPYADNIEIIPGDAAENLLQLPQKPQYDMVFIDAAKGQYPDYLNKVLPLLNPKGVIIADNVLFRGYVLGDETPPKRYKTIVKRLKQYIEMVNNSEKFQTTIYENGDGLAVTRLVK